MISIKIIDLILLKNYTYTCYLLSTITCISRIGLVCLILISHPNHYEKSSYN